MLGNRKISKILAAAFQLRHYLALINMCRHYPKFLQNLWRYLTSKGSYPYDIEVRTPVRRISIRLYSHHDLLTVNEIFCRKDYFADGSIRRVIDLGSNIGISALYFLTRNNDSICTLYEPDPKNIEKLRLNLTGFESRCTIVAAAVSDRSGRLDFKTEPTGRYGKIGEKSGNSITVDCLHINEVLKNALQLHSRIDILKIDTEGVEVQTVNAIDPEFAKKISRIYLEARPSCDLIPETFRNRQYGSIRQLANRTGV
jgi:FkbM family methyltransferase